MPQQLQFELPAHVSMGAEDYFVSKANQAAHTQVMGVDGWPGGKLALVGPAGSGKTHLSRIWTRATGALYLNAESLSDLVSLPEKGASVAIDDADQLTAGTDETLFHLFNHLTHTGGRMLVTARTAPTRWATRLPDLASRMQTLSIARIAEPDDDLLRAVLLKHFADRQLKPDPGLIDWLLPRMERSFQNASRLVDELDRQSLAQSRVINRALARSILDKP